MLVTITWKDADPTVTSIADPSEALTYVQGLLDIHAARIADWSIAGNDPAEVRLANIDINRNHQDFILTLFDRSDKDVAVIHTDTERLQEFALRVLTQTTYAFADAVHNHKEG